MRSSTRCSRSCSSRTGRSGSSSRSDAVLIRLPTTRRIAERLGVPHYYVLPLIGALEADGLVTRAERVGIRTTPEGTRRFFERIDEDHRADAEALLGPGVYALLLAGARRTPNL